MTDSTSYTLPNTCPRCGSVVLVVVGWVVLKCPACGYVIKVCNGGRYVTTGTLSDP